MTGRSGAIFATLAVSFLAVILFAGCREKAERTDPEWEAFIRPISLDNLVFDVSTKDDVVKNIFKPQIITTDDDGNERFLYAFRKEQVEMVGFQVSRPRANTPYYIFVVEFDGDILKEYYVVDLETSKVRLEDVERR